MDNRRILVIDDDPEIREIYQKIIAPAKGTSENYRAQISQLLSLDDNEKQKFTLEIASQGQEGFSLVQKGLAEDKPFALAFIDIRMPPGWGGISTATRIREIDPNIEIVIVTAFSDRSLEEIIDTVGTPEKLILLRKPFDHEEVIQLSYALTEKWNLARKEELQRIELQSILMTSPAAIFTVNRDRIITSWNLAAERITGYPADEVVGKVCIYQRVAVDQRCKKCALNFEQPLNGNVQNREIEIRDKSGDRHVVSKSIAYLKDNKGRVIQAIESFWDITPLEDAHVKLAGEIVKRKNIAKEAAVLAERSRLARELHDSVSQSLYSVSLLGETARHLAEAGDLRSAHTSLSELNSTVQQTLKEMRLLIYNLRPEIIKKEGFKAAIQQRLDTVESRSGIKGKLFIDEEIELSEPEEDTFYRIIQEALNNTLKHSSAAKVTVEVHTTKDTAEIKVSDDGIGFESGLISGNGGIGLTSIKERAENLKGTFSFSSSPGKGTHLNITVPRKF